MRTGDRYLVKTRVFELFDNYTLKKDDIIIFLEARNINGIETCYIWNEYTGSHSVSKEDLLIHCEKESE